MDQSESLIDDLRVKKLVEEQYFTVYHWNLNGKAPLEMDKNFLQVSVIAGNAEIVVGGKTFPLEKGAHFVLPFGVREYEISGKAEFIVSHE